MRHAELLHTRSPVLKSAQSPRAAFFVSYAHSAAQSQFYWLHSAEYLTHDQKEYSAEHEEQGVARVRQKRLRALGQIASGSAP